MATEDEGDVVEGVLFDHCFCAGGYFLGGLEDEADGCGEGWLVGEDGCGSEEDGGVAIVAAGVHDVGGLGGKGEIGLFVDGECVDVGAEGDGREVWV